MASSLFSASEDNTIRCWNSVTGEPIGHPWTGHTHSITSLSLSPDGSILASASWDQTVRFWDATSGNPVGPPLKHDGSVHTVGFSPSGDFVASAGASGEIYLWRVPWLHFVEDQVRRTISDLPPRLPPGTEQVSGFELPLRVSATVPSGTISLVLHPHASAGNTVRNVKFWISHPMSSKSKINIQLEEASVTFIDVATLAIQCQRRFGHGVQLTLTYYLRLFQVAVKALRFSFTTEGDLGNKSVKMLRRELGIWKRLNHINIVPFLGIAYGFGMDSSMSLVSLWMPNESLHNFLGKYGDDLGVDHRLQLLLDIASGLRYLHSQAFPIVHGDLNCNNVLLDADYTARLADFGYASLIGNIPEALTYLQRSTARPGALRWNAPEQVDPEASCTQTTKSDIYSFGCVALQGGLLVTNDAFILMVLQVLSGKQPWSEVRQDAAVILCLAKGHLPGRPESRAMDDSHWNLIQDCLSSIEERPATEVIILTIQRFLRDCPQSQLLHDLSSYHGGVYCTAIGAIGSSNARAWTYIELPKTADVVVACEAAEPPIPVIYRHLYLQTADGVEIPPRRYRADCLMNRSGRNSRTEELPPVPCLKPNFSQTDRDGNGPQPPSPTLAATRALYTTRAIHPYLPPASISHRSLPFFQLIYGGSFDVLRGYGHPLTHVDLLLCR
ncbi:kinase-like domain-containing protein [Lanmaoa asiatica]|nr:kinase-like domain-containing protein [Lanmaoa asiatica]